MISGILIIANESGNLLYFKEIIKHYGLRQELGGNALQLSAILYTLYLSSTAISSQSSPLSWIFTNHSFIMFEKLKDVLLVIIMSVASSSSSSREAIISRTLSKMAVVRQIYNEIMDDIAIIPTNRHFIPIFRTAFNKRLSEGMNIYHLEGKKEEEQEDRSDVSIVKHGHSTRMMVVSEDVSSSHLYPSTPTPMKDNSHFSSVATTPGTMHTHPSMHGSQSPHIHDVIVSKSNICQLLCGMFSCSSENSTEIVVTGGNNNSVCIVPTNTDTAYI